MGPERNEGSSSRGSRNAPPRAPSLTPRAWAPCELFQTLLRIEWFRLLDTAKLTLDERRAIVKICEHINYGEYYRERLHGAVSDASQPATAAPSPKSEQPA